MWQRHDTWTAVTDAGVKLGCSFRPACGRAQPQWMWTTISEVPQPDDVAVGQLPLLHRRVVDGGAVGGVEVGEQCHLAVPPDLQVPTRHPGVRQPELGVLPSADDVGAVTQLVGPSTAVVELQGDRGAGGRGSRPVRSRRSRRACRRAGRGRSSAPGLLGVSTAA